MRGMDKLWVGEEDTLHGEDVPIKTLNDLRTSLIREVGDMDEIEIPNDGRRKVLPIHIIAKLRVRDEIDDYEEQREEQMVFDTN